MAQTDHTSSNIAQYSVSELGGVLKRSLEDRFGYVRVRGEISGYRGPHSSGHAYFSLKDEAARLDVVIWRATFSRMRVKPEEGLEVVASGKITTYPGKSSYQLVVDTLEPAGVGALLALLEARKRQLSDEGLFRSDRKRSLPFLPRVIGIVTSPSGAVIRDILHRLADRFPTHVVVWPVRVQGEGSAEEIAAAIRGLNTLSEVSEVLRPEILIVGRGGGSLEDLWSFNDELVVRATAESGIPVISAVGHETDWTLIDLAADFRAPTPSAAAEISVPVRSDLIFRVAQLEARALGAITRALQQKSGGLRFTVRGVSSIDFRLSVLHQRLDGTFDQLESKMGATTRIRSIRLAKLAVVLPKFSPLVVLVTAAERSRAVLVKMRLLNQQYTAASRRKLEHVENGLRVFVTWKLGRNAEYLSMIASRWESRIHGVAKVVRAERSDLRRIYRALHANMQGLLRRRSSSAIIVIQILATLNCKRVLARGYTLVLDKKGSVITKAGLAEAARDISIRFADGDVMAKIGARRARNGNVKRTVPLDQSTLF